MLVLYAFTFGNIFIFIFVYAESSDLNTALAYVLILLCLRNRETLEAVRNERMIK